MGLVRVRLLLTLGFQILDFLLEFFNILGLSFVGLKQMPEECEDPLDLDKGLSIASRFRENHPGGT